MFDLWTGAVSLTLSKILRARSSLLRRRSEALYTWRTAQQLGTQHSLGAKIAMALHPTVAPNVEYDDDDDEDDADDEPRAYRDPQKAIYYCGGS